MDQADRIEIAIRSIKSYVSEVVVIDGGSKDNTVKIAESLGAKVYTKKWEDDFGSQRSYSIKKASNDWILVLDSDESIEFGDGINFEKIILDNPDYDGFRFTRANYLDKKQTGSEFDFDKQIRLFGRHGYYNDKIHEVVKGLKSIKDIDKSQCLMLHYKSKDEQRSHLLYQKKLIINNIKELEQKLDLSEEDKKRLVYEKKMLEVWDTWWQDAK